MPVIMAKLAKSNVALNALNKAQSAVQTAMAPLLAGLGTINTVEELMPVLNALKSGLELTPAQVTQLYSITADELAEYQSIADKYQLLITVRSRAFSSIKWITESLAMLKPEALKIKTVNVLDTKLGYAESLEGSLVFQEPEPLVEWKKSGGAISSYVQSFVESKGFAPGTGEYYDAINRVSLRISEYNKWAESYFKWNERGWIDTTFNWDGNAVTTATRTAVEEKVGFRLRPVGNNTWIVEMQNPKTGQFVPVTGDIDAIAYTNLDGSPLTEAQHADVLDAVRKNELLQAQHGESATYVNGGVDFVQDQFKPDEPGLQLAPGSVAPRVVRLNTKQSRWVDASNYNLSWDGGYISAGSPLPVAVTGFIAPQISTAMDAATDTSPVPTALPGVAPSIGGANVGRCLMTFANDATAVPLVMNADGSLATVGADGQVKDDKSLDKKCFSEGPITTVSITPVTAVSVTTPAGATELPIGQGAFDAGEAPADGFQVGDEVTVDPGGPDEETDELTGFGSLIFAHPLKKAHKPGETVVATHLVKRTLTKANIAQMKASADSALASDDDPWRYGALGLVLVGAAAAPTRGAVRRRRAKRSDRAAVKAAT